MFRRFGAAVTIVSPRDHLLPHEDPDVSEAIEGVLRAEGSMLAPGTAGLAGRARVGVGGGVGAETRGDVRRRRAAGIARISSWPPAAAPQHRRSPAATPAAWRSTPAGTSSSTSATRPAPPAPMPLGDCIPGPQFTHVSWDDHRVLFNILTGRAARDRSDRVVPWTVFTDPAGGRESGFPSARRARGIRGGGRDDSLRADRPRDRDRRARPLGQGLVDPASERILRRAHRRRTPGELIHVSSVLMQVGALGARARRHRDRPPHLRRGLQTALMKLPRYAL